MKLYFAPGACSLSPHIVLREAGHNFELEQVNNAEKKTKSGTDYWTINPKGQVPVLELDNGERLTEGPVIVQYLADPKPAAGLAPACGSVDRYRVQEWLNFTTSELHKMFGPIFRPTTPDEFKKLSKENLGKRFDWIEKQLAGRPTSWATSSRLRTPTCSRSCAGPPASRSTWRNGRTSKPTSTESPRARKCRRR